MTGLVTAHAAPFVARVAFGLVAKQALLQIPDARLCVLQLRLERRLALRALHLQLAKHLLVTLFAPRGAAHRTLVQGPVTMRLRNQLDVLQTTQRDPFAGKWCALHITCRRTRLLRNSICTHDRNISEKLLSSRILLEFLDSIEVSPNIYPEFDSYARKWLISLT